MKKLLIFRHGKSSHDISDIKDIDRPLKKRGITDAIDITQRLMEQNIFVDKILSSPANRALHTASIFARTMKVPFERIEINPLIYFSYHQDVIEMIKGVDESIETLAVFGHNPTLTDVANQFLVSPIFELPTAGCILLQFEGEWKNLSKDNLVAAKTEFPGKK